MTYRSKRLFSLHNLKSCLAKESVYSLRDDDGTLIGYYEKHEYRNRETIGLYDFKKY